MLDYLDKSIPVFGTIVNVFTVLIGSGIGLLIHARLPQRYITAAFQGIGIITIFLGIKMALEGEEMILIIFSILTGAIVGEKLDIDQRLGNWFNRWKSSGNTFSEGLISAFLLFCMGSMTFLGALEEGTGKFPHLLIAKSLLDGFSSMALASSLGIGVMFSVIPLFVYQGGLTLFAMYFSETMNPSIIHDLTATGGLLLIGLGIHLLQLKEIKVVNFLPSLLFVVVLKLIL